VSHPITPPPELVQQWWEESNYQQYTGSEAEEYVVSMAAQWGADQELEACVQWTINTPVYYMTPGALRAARRPKPPSLKEQALEAMRRNYNPDNSNDFAIIRRALEQLDD
jgi:hypothetical protein